MVWGEPVQEPWEAAAALPAPAARAGEKKRKEMFIASGGSQDDPDGLSHPWRRDQGKGTSLEREWQSRCLSCAGALVMVKVVQSTAPDF